MSRAIPVNKKSFYAGGNAVEIAMPPLDQVPPIQTAQDPWSQQQAPQEQQQNQAFGIPDELPQEVVQEMQSQEESDEQVESPQKDTQEVLQSTRMATKSKEENFKAIREGKERAERERDLLLSKLLEMQQSAQPKQQVEPVEEVDSDFNFNVNDDDLIEGKHAKQLVAEIKKLKTEMRKSQSQSYQTSIEARIQAEFPDFAKVVSVDNVNILNEEMPELAATLRDTKDKYTQAAAAYKAIKRMGIYKDESEFMRDKQKAIDNSKKPRPLTSVNPQQGDSPLSKANAFANGLTPELQEQLRKEMYAARKAH